MMNEIKDKKIIFSIVGIAILLIGVVGVTYAFFNYTRTGSANNIKTGRIYFNSEQDGSLQLTNIFPVKSTDVNPNNLDSVSIAITGDTTYIDGEEFEITLTSVNDTFNGKKIPINYIATYTANTDAVIGTASDNYWNAREQKDASIYTLTETGSVEEGKQILVGYIDNGETGINGTLTIKAYIDADRIAISDTYPEEVVRTVKTTGYSSSNCETVLNGVTDASTYCASVESLQGAIDNGNLTTEQITLLVNAGIVTEYTNGTTSTWVNGRTVFTTTEWNSFQNSETPISFKIKAESNEGIWVDAPPRPAYQVINEVSNLENVAGAKRYVGASPNNYVIFNDEQWRIIGVYGDKVKIVKATPSTTSQRFNGSSRDNSWEGSELEEYLNDTYFPTLSEKAQEMVDENGVWHIGTSTTSENASAAYTSESSVVWTGKVGLVTSYEYLYAALNDGICWTTFGSSYDGSSSCCDKDWLWTTLTDNAWTINSVRNQTSYVLGVQNGHVSNNYFTNKYVASPVVYLKKEVIITGGNGEPNGKEYTLSYKAL